MNEHTKQGIGFVIAAMACFALSDTTVKWVVLSISSWTLLWWRYLFHFITSAIGYRRQRVKDLRLPENDEGKVVAPHKLPLLWVRSALLTCMSALGLYTLGHMPVAEFTAIGMITPVVVVAMAALLLGEHVSLVRWVAVLCAFAGAALVLRPSGAIPASVAWMPLVMVAMYSAFQILTKHLSAQVSATTMQFFAGLVGFVLSSFAVVFTLANDWQILTASSTLWFWVAVVCACSTTGQWFIAKGFSLAPASVATTYFYSGLLFATLLGWAVFDAMPDTLTLLGMGIIAVSGVAAAVMRK